MRDSIHYIKVDESEKVLKALAASVEAGLSVAMEGIANKPGFTGCMRMEKTSLQTILKSSTLANSALEIRFHTGLAGSALLLVRTNDMFRIGEMIAGVEAKIDDAISPELMEGCMRFFTTVMGECEKNFALRYSKAIASEPPELINPDGKSGSLMPLADAYENALCMTFQFIAEPQLDSRIQMIVQGQLLDSLIMLIPDYDPNPAPAETPRQQRQQQQRQQQQQKEQKESEAQTEILFGPSNRGNFAEKQTGSWNIDLILDVELPIAVSFGGTEMQLKDVLKLGVGSVIELDKSVNEPVTIIVNQKPIARGEVVMVDGNYGVRVLEVESTADRIRSLG